MTAEPPPPPPEKPPTAFSSDLGGRIRWFGIWFLVGLAPFLGKVKVPGFSALIEMYPRSLQGWLIPLSGIFMGMMAVAAEFVSFQRSSERTLARWFGWNAGIFALSFILLTTVYIFTVVQVERTLPEKPDEPSVTVSLAVITGSRSVPAQFAGSDCKCIRGEAAERCLADISLKPANVATCFGSERIAISTLALVLLYLAVTGSFVAAVAMLVIRQRSHPG